MYNYDYDDYECETCDRVFPSERAAAHHMNARNHWAAQFQCETCEKFFITQNDANRHMNRLEHWAPRFECETCDRVFRSQNGANRHMSDFDHWAPRFSCEACDEEFMSELDARAHMAKTNHWRRHYCNECKRGFQNENNLRMHLNSHVHVGQGIFCPFCKRSFTTATGLTNHLETGSCTKARNLNRETIYKAVKARDPHGLVTQKLLTWDDSQNGHVTTQMAWNGQAYECYLCHRRFKNGTALDQHVNSPVHKQKLYHCPSRKCAKEFVTLAAMFNHLESESCGDTRFGKVQQSVGNFLTGKYKLITFNGSS